MGLGLIALGFVLLEGLTMNVNSMKLLPEYISLTILLIGILVIKKKVKIKYLDYALMLGTIQFIYHFVVPQFESHFPFVLTTVLFVMEIVVKLSFYAMLFKGIDALVKNNRTRLYMKIFWIIYALLSAYLLFIYFQVNAQYPQNYIEAPQTMLSGMLLWSKVLLCDMLSYRFYKHNKELEDEYEDLSAEPIRNYPSYLYVSIMIISVVLLVAMQKPVFYALRDSAIKEYMWYGSVDNEIIIEGYGVEEKTYTKYSHWLTQHPEIWINEEDYKKASYGTVIEYLGEFEQIVVEQSRIDKEFDINPEINYFKGDYQYGKIDGYRCVVFDQESHYNNNAYAKRYQIKIKVILYDNDMNVIEEYQVPLHDRSPRLTEYHYEDNEMKVEEMMVDGDFIVKMPRIIFKHNIPENYQVLISSTSSLDEYYVNNKVAQLDETFELFGQFIYEETISHIYLPTKQDYYIHIAYFENETPHIVKTVRLEK